MKLEVASRWSYATSNPRRSSRFLSSLPRHGRSGFCPNEFVGVAALRLYAGDMALQLVRLVIDPFLLVGKLLPVSLSMHTKTGSVVRP
jgi:hypothetical protein